MKGSYSITVQNKRIRYDFQIRRNITVIRGNSATGKTTLIDMIREHYEEGENSAVELRCDKQCAVIDGRSWKGQLSDLSDSIVFIDEGNQFVFSDEFASFIQKTDNYYVIVSREGIPSLPYSVDEIYGIRNSGKYGSLKRTYNEFYHLYEKSDFSVPVIPDTIITEDSNSGYQFFCAVCSRNNIMCVSANGKSSIFETAEKSKGKSLLIIADGAALGSEIGKLVELVKVRNNITLYFPESFEWLILTSGVINNSEITDILSSPGEYIESGEYFSWERYFTALLVRITKDTYMQYTKKKINDFYIREHVANRILQEIYNVQLSSETETMKQG